MYTFKSWICHTRKFKSPVGESERDSNLSWLQCRLLEQIAVKKRFFFHLSLASSKEKCGNGNFLLWQHKCCKIQTDSSPLLFSLCAGWWHVGKKKKMQNQKNVSHANKLDEYLLCFHPVASHKNLQCQEQKNHFFLLLGNGRMFYLLHLIKCINVQNFAFHKMLIM